MWLVRIEYGNHKVVLRDIFGYIDGGKCGPVMVRSFCLAGILNEYGALLDASTLVSFKNWMQVASSWYASYAWRC